MRNGRAVLGWAAMAIIALAALEVRAAEQGARTRRAAGPGAGGARAQNVQEVMKQSGPLVVQAVAADLGLSKEQADNFLKAYMTARETTAKRILEAGEDREKRREAFTQGNKEMQEAIRAALGPENAKKAGQMLRMGGLENSIITLLRSRVEEAKVEKALPVLVTCHKATAELPRGEESRQKRQELRDATAKELAPIVGEEAAGAWAKARYLGATGGARGTRTGTDRPTREGGARQR